MAISGQVVCVQSLNLHRRRCCFCSSAPKSVSRTHLRNPNYSTRLRFTPKSSSFQASVEGPKSPKPQRERFEGPGPDSARGSSSGLLSNLVGRLRGDELGLEILSVALPAALALAADPIASLVDTAFVGHIGSIELAAVGVSASVFNLVSKLFNVPLLNITTSFVAEEWALYSENDNNLIRTSQANIDIPGNVQSKKRFPSVSTSLALAAGIGILEAVVLFFGSGLLLNIMGISVDSPIHIPAENFLTIRAFGAPPIVVALAAQGTFRGFMDTRTPLYAIGVGNLLNAILDLVLIFLFGFGIGGAAVSTVTSEYLIAFILLWKLNDRVLLVTPNIDGRRVAHYLKSGPVELYFMQLMMTVCITFGGLLSGRSLAVVITMTLATSMAAREGTEPMAGHQICLQVWLAVSLLTDALALAGQALLASSFSQGDYGLARQVIYRVLQIGLITGITFGVVLLLGFGAFSGLFSTDLNVLEIASSGIWFVAGSQPINAVAFVIDGLYYGVADFEYAAYSMLLVGLVSSVVLLLAAPIFGLVGVWSGLFLFMTLRVTAGIWRLGTKTGPWEMIWCKMDEESD